MLKNAPVVMMLLACAGCDKVPLLAPTGSTITLTAPARILPTGGTTDVTATVLEASGSPVQNGTTVRFTTTLGRVDPVEVQTINGVAITRFFAGDSAGVAEVRANSGNAGGGTSTGGTGGTTTATNVLSITIGAAAANTVVLTANPSSVSPTGSTVALTASVLDASGNRLTGIPVTFSTTSGQLSPTAAVTDAAGDARASLTANAPATVTASAGAKTATAAITVRATSSVTLTCAGACAANVGQSVSFTIARGNDTPVLTNAVIDFGDGSSQVLGSITGTTTVAHTYGNAGTFTATVRATDAGGSQTSASVAVIITQRAPINATLTAANDANTARWTFTAGPTSTATDPIESYTFNFGDGSDPVTQSGNITSHIYGSNGRKIVTVTVRAQDGRTGSTRTEINVANAS